MEMLHLMDGTVGQFHVADKHTDYMIPNELFDTTIKAFGHCEDASKLTSKLNTLRSKVFMVLYTFFSISAKGMTDNCEAAYTMLKCFKADNNDFWFM